MTFLSIIIPAFNERERLPKTLEQLKNFLPSQGYTYEILVVDDGSSDNTVQYVEQYASHLPGLKVITNDHNKGKGGVVCQGMLEAVGKWRLFMDADSSTPIAELPKLLAQAAQYEVIIGSRFLEANSIKTKRSFKRRFISLACNVLVQNLLLPGIRDTQCGFKLFSASAAKQIFPRQTLTGWLFDAEILTIARVQEYAIKEVAVDWYEADNSNLRAAVAVSRSLRDLYTIRRNLKNGIYA